MGMGMGIYLQIPTHMQTLALGTRHFIDVANIYHHHIISPSTVWYTHTQHLWIEIITVYLLVLYIYLWIIVLIHDEMESDCVYFVKPGDVLILTCYNIYEGYEKASRRQLMHEVIKTK